MTGPEHSYVRVPYPWSASLDASSRSPARHYAALIGQAMRYRLPARARLGAMQAFVARNRLVPEGLLASSLRALPRSQQPHLEELRRDLIGAWPDLRRKLDTLPATPAQLSLLALQRGTTLTVFAFVESASPLLVLKLPTPSDPSTEREAEALREAEPVGIAPRALGSVGPALVEEALEGAPLEVEPLRVADVRTLPWPAPLEELTRRLEALGAATAKPVRPPQLTSLLERASGHESLSPAAQARLASARDELAQLEVAVLRHGDVSAQNCIFRGTRLVGLVDWESARTDGMPGFDAFNASLSYLEHGLGLRRWSDDLIVEAFRAAWLESPFYRRARSAARHAVVDAGVPERNFEAVEIAYYSQRLLQRLDTPDRFPTGHRVAAAMLELVCASQTAA